ncbi:MAG TPA: hypothetical protein VHN14_12695 [Kofleriaceae bacterium]|nr:hypothetical protein [Kofleriaceae bacterium]
MRLTRSYEPWAHAAWLEGKRTALAFLLANAQRSNPKRDRKTGRLRSGLLVVGDRS